MSSIVERIRHVSDNTNFSLDTKVITAKLELTGICPMQCPFCYNKTMKEKILLNYRLYKILKKMFNSTTYELRYSLGAIRSGKKELDFSIITKEGF